MSKIRKLVLIDKENMLSDSIISQIKRTLKLYIASPWNPVLKKVISEGEYKAKLEEFISQNFSTPKELLCSKFNVNHREKAYQDVLCQSHAGNLLEHSQWAALQIMKWGKEDNSLVRGLDLNTLIVAAFFHDIGKAGDCVQSCNVTGCWYDMYAADKYDKKGDAIHPQYCGDMLMGKILFYPNCKCVKPQCGINIRSLIEREFPEVDVNVVALTAYMHWEFGKINKTVDYETGVEIPLLCRLNAYIRDYVKFCKACDLDPKNIVYLKMCIAVSCADIAAGTNARLLPSVDGIVPARAVYLGKDPWIIYGMDKKHNEYRSQLIDYFFTVFEAKVNTPLEYKAVFQNKDKHTQVSNLVGRVLRGKTDSDFYMLSPDLNRKLILFMNSDGLQNLIGKSLKAILSTIGYPTEYAEKLIKEGTKFKLLVAPKQDEILRATWDNLVKLVDIQYMNTNIPLFLRKNLDELKLNSFKDGYDKIMRNADDNMKMTAESLNESEGKLWEVRKFLNDVLNLNPLYMGDGYTYSETGKRGLAEYFSLNKPINSLHDAILIDLN